MPIVIQESVVVSRSSFDSSDPYSIIQSNISFLNSLFESQIRADEVCRDALRSYYVDYYLAQVQNGGFSQFVFNSGWSDEVAGHVREGLRAMGAGRHLKLFERLAEVVDGLGSKRLHRFLGGEYFGENADRDLIAESNLEDEFYRISEQEDLIALNSGWLRGLPHLVIMETEEMEKEVARLVSEIPDMDERIAAARAAEPRYYKLIRKLCSVAGHELDRVTAGDPTHEHDGRSVLAWHFITDKGHHYMVDLGHEAFMFHGESRSQVARVDASEEMSGDPS